MIEINSLTKIYNTSEKAVTALNAVTYRFPETGLVFIVGKSGSGKSTLLNLLGGFDYATSGNILVDGVDVSKFTVKQFDAYRNNYVGLVFQNYNLISDFNVAQNVGYSLDLQGISDYEEQVDKVLSDVDLSEYKKRKITELSGGQQQRVAIARAIVKDPKLVLADEPTGNLDSETAKQIFELLKKISQDRLVLVVTHDLDYAAEYGDEMLKIVDGNIENRDSREVARRNEPMTATAQADVIGKAKRWKLKTAIRYGLMSIRRDLRRMILGLVLAVVSLTVFVSGLMPSMTNSVDLRFENIRRANLSTAVIKKENNEWFTIDECNQFINDHPDTKFNLMLHARVCGNVEDSHSLDEFDTVKMSYLVVVNDSNKHLYQDKLLPGGRLPQDADEVVIPYSYALAMLHGGYVHWYYETKIGSTIHLITGEEIVETYESLESEVLQLNDVYDLVGRTLDMRSMGDKDSKIVGIWDNRIENLDTLKELKEKDKNGDQTFFEEQHHSGLMVSYRAAKDDYLDVGLVSTAFLETADFTNAERNMLQLVFDDSLYSKRDVILALEKEGYYVSTLADNLVRDAANERMSISVTLSFLSVAIGIFAFLLLYFVFKGNIDKNKRKIGIMRSLGTTSSDVILMYGIQGVIMGLIMAVLSIPLTFGFMEMLAYLVFGMWWYCVLGVRVNVTFAIYQPLAFVYLLAVLAVAVTVSVLPPILRIRKIAPINTVKEE